jgi:hypothetical protein
MVAVQIPPPDFDRVFAALADHTRRDIVRRAISAEEGVLELASHFELLTRGRPNRARPAYRRRRRGSPAESEHCVKSSQAWTRQFYLPVPGVWF